MSDKTHNDKLREMAEKIAILMGCHHQMDNDLSMCPYVPQIESALREVYEEGAKFESEYMKAEVNEAYRRGFSEAIEKAADALPDNWLDRLLSGKESDEIPWGCPEIERYTRGLADRIRSLKSETSEPKAKL